MMKLNEIERHTDLIQAQREEVMQEFKSGRVSILVAYNRVSSGFDIDYSRLVINYEITHDSEDYVLHCRAEHHS